MSEADAAYQQGYDSGYSRGLKHGAAMQGAASAAESKAEQRRQDRKIIATACLQSIVARERGPHVMEIGDSAVVAVQYADALLAELDKPT